MSADDNYFRQEARARREIEQEWNKKEMCNYHRPSPLNYSEWHDWAEKKIKQGHQQKQCLKCGKWFFKCEM